jgi:hypothetical protein
MVRRWLDENPKSFLRTHTQFSRRIPEGLVTSGTLGYEVSMPERQTDRRTFP